MYAAPDRSATIVRADKVLPGTGKTIGRHTWVIWKDDGEVSNVDGDGRFAAVFDPRFKLRNIKYARVEKSRLVTDDKEFGGQWTRGAEAQAGFEKLLNNNEFDVAFATAKVDGCQMVYRLAVTGFENEFWVETMGAGAGHKGLNSAELKEFWASLKDPHLYRFDPAYLEAPNDSGKSEAKS
jgi:hypothetical protein